MKEFLHNTWKHRAHVIMSLPAVLILFFSVMFRWQVLCWHLKILITRQDCGRVRGMGWRILNSWLRRKQRLST